MDVLNSTWFPRKIDWKFGDLLETLGKTFIGAHFLRPRKKPFKRGESLRVAEKTDILSRLE